MKKVVTLLLTAGMLMSTTIHAYAIDFKAKGQWIMSFDYGEGMSGYSKTRSGGNMYGSGYGNPSEDTFEARQRVRLQLQAIASETLSGTVYFEIGESIWGNAGSGGALGADEAIIELKHAYIDWVVPETALKIRMGIQSIGLPSFPAGTGGTQVFYDDVAGIILSNRFSDMISLTAFWARPYNDNFNNVDNANLGISDNMLDNLDIFGLLLPVTFDGIKMTPWMTYAAVGKNFARDWTASDADNMGNAFTNVYTGLFPMGTAEKSITSFTRPDNNLNSYGSVFHVGFTGEVTLWDPVRLAWDFNYGDAQYGVDYLQRQGFFGSLLAEYKMFWGTPGIYGWYSTGDDGNLKNGSERMPTMDTGGGDINFSHFGSSGNPYIARANVIGNTLIGTWGIGARVRDFSFVEDLSHTFRVNYMSGTNSTKMARYMRGAVPPPANMSDTFSPSANPEAAFDTPAGIYMTTKDSALELGFTTEYQVYENLQIMVDAGYMALWMNQDSSVWANAFSATDAWNVNASFVYSF